jgi:hypothetical protein
VPILAFLGLPKVDKLVSRDEDATVVNSKVQALPGKDRTLLFVLPPPRLRDQNALLLLIKPHRHAKSTDSAGS